MRYKIYTTARQSRTEQSDLEHQKPSISSTQLNDCKTCWTQGLASSWGRYLSIHLRNSCSCTSVSLSSAPAIAMSSPSSNWEADHSASSCSMSFVPSSITSAGNSASASADAKDSRDVSTTAAASSRGKTHQYWSLPIHLPCAWPAVEVLGALSIDYGGRLNWPWQRFLGSWQAWQHEYQSSDHRHLVQNIKSL